MSDDVAIIERFVQLTWKRNSEPLSDGQTLELQRLRSHLEATLAGATKGTRQARVRPAVTVGGSPSADLAPGGAPSSPEPAADPAPAPAPPPEAPAPVPTAPASGAVSVADIQLPEASAYTPSQRPVHARDYFGEEPDSPIQTTPDLATVPAPEHQPEPDTPAPTLVPDPPARSTTPPEAAAAPRASRRGRSALVYLSDGTSIRGSARAWDPAADVLELRTKEGPRRIELADILVAFMGPAPGDGVQEPPHGQRVKVALTNGKRLVGVTTDYEAGRDRFTLLPDARSSGVDRVWIPAASVEAIDHA